ncbi:MAG: hypothetical protein KDH96_06345 [Candidatus Riesia sp.]|nr:hypothetical protein [Candidatus Riesia sp.]
MKLLILLESLKVKELTDSIEQIVAIALEKAEQTPQGPDYIDRFKKVFWNIVKAKCKIEFNITVLPTNLKGANAYTTRSKPLNLYVNMNVINRTAEYLSSVNKKNKKIGTAEIISTLVHEITHLKQFSKLSNSLSSTNFYNLNKPHPERHAEIEAICNSIWPIVKNKLQNKNGDIIFNAGVIHNILTNFFDEHYNMDFKEFTDSVKKQYYKKLYKLFATDTGMMPTNNFKINDIVMIYSDPIEDTPNNPDKYIIVDIDGYKVTVRHMRLNIDTHKYEPTGPNILVNSMFIAPFSMLNRDMFNDDNYLN